MCEEKQSWRNMTAEKATKRHRLQGNRELSGRRFREGVPYLLRKKIYIQRTMYGSELAKHGAYKPNWPKRYKLGQRCCWGLPFPPFSGRASRKFREIRGPIYRQLPCVLSDSSATLVPLLYNAFVSNAFERWVSAPTPAFHTHTRLALVRNHFAHKLTVLSVISTRMKLIYLQ